MNVDPCYHFPGMHDVVMVSMYALGSTQLHTSVVVNKISFGYPEVSSIPSRGQWVVNTMYSQLLYATETRLTSNHMGHLCTLEFPRGVLCWWSVFSTWHVCGAFWVNYCQWVPGVQDYGGAALGMVLNLGAGFKWKPLHNSLSAYKLVH